MQYTSSIQYLLSLPPAMVNSLESVEGRRGLNWFAVSDPEGAYLGSGGATAHLLAEAWKASGDGKSFLEWLQDSRKLVIHGGGQSRRLPAYAPVGKPFLPLPVQRSSYGQSIDRALFDSQYPVYERLFRTAPERYVAMVASGDVLLNFAPVRNDLPEVDVLIFGMTATPDLAKDFGVLFTRGRQERLLSFFLQKPSAEEIAALSGEYDFLVDTGIWLLSARAVMTLMAKCGWSESEQDFADSSPAQYELYARLGTALGLRPSMHDPEINSLSAAAYALGDPEFYHLGTSRQLIESLTRLQNRNVRESSLRGFRLHPDQFIQNSAVYSPMRPESNHTIWVENSCVPETWRLTCGNMVTGAPDNAWELTLEPDVCLDLVPVGDTEYCVRPYGMDDKFSGPVGSPSTFWFGRPCQDWLETRDISFVHAGLRAETDVQQASLFPVLSREELSSDFLQWMLSACPTPNPAWRALWLKAPRLSATGLAQQANIVRLYEQRSDNQREALCAMYRNAQRGIFYQLDLEAAASLVPITEENWPPRPSAVESDPILCSKDEMFRAVLRRNQGDGGWPELEAAAFGWLRHSLVDPQQLSATPARTMLHDQIVWARSPVRLDLAGGWTDTPPYCLEHGGKVLNLAVNLNGQPPVQVFVKPSDELQIVIRSIDLGIETRVRSFEALETYGEPDSEFALAKAALALSGFLPSFHAEREYASLEGQLKALGGGLEITLLAAAPKGSGLGTSSILAATLLAALSDACGFCWDSQELIRRTLALEQMLTTGGGWQDQAGAIFKGVKLVEAGAGLDQKVTARWLPEHLFSAKQAGQNMLLYYTGVTRLAKNILQDIVRGMFLNRARVLETLGAIGRNAEDAFLQVQRGDYPALCDSVRTSWELNQRLDSGTNPPEIQQILDSIADNLLAAKLLGAGGGGYFLFLAKDARAARRIREHLTFNPPNQRARFVDFSISETGLQVTRS